MWGVAPVVLVVPRKCQRKCGNKARPRKFPGSCVLAGSRVDGQFVVDDREGDGGEDEDRESDQAPHDHFAGLPPHQLLLLDPLDLPSRLVVVPRQEHHRSVVHFRISCGVIPTPLLYTME